VGRLVELGFAWAHCSAIVTVGSVYERDLACATQWSIHSRPVLGGRGWPGVSTSRGAFTSISHASSAMQYPYGVTSLTIPSPRSAANTRSSGWPPNVLLPDSIAGWRAWRSSTVRRESRRSIARLFDRRLADALTSVHVASITKIRSIDPERISASQTNPSWDRTVSFRPSGPELLWIRRRTITEASRTPPATLGVGSLSHSTNFLSISMCGSKCRVASGRTPPLSSDWQPDDVREARRQPGFLRFILLGVSVAPEPEGYPNKKAQPLSASVHGGGRSRRGCHSITRPPGVPAASKASPKSPPPSRA